MPGNRLLLIKSVHCIIFVFMSICVSYILFCGITQTYHWTLVIAISAIFLKALYLFTITGSAHWPTLPGNTGMSKAVLPIYFFRHGLCPMSLKFAPSCLFLDSSCWQ